MKEKFTTAGANELENSENEKGNIAGFWRGLWHGLIAPSAPINPASSGCCAI
jgi:hypothetical protein